jgi:hypothetical protein
MAMHWKCSATHLFVVSLVLLLWCRPPLPQLLLLLLLPLLLAPEPVCVTPCTPRPLRNEREK